MASSTTMSQKGGTSIAVTFSPYVARRTSRALCQQAEWVVDHQLLQVEQWL